MGFYKLVPGFCTYLKACSRSPQISAGLLQVSSGLCRPTLQVLRPRPGLIFRSLCRPLFRSLQVTAGLCTSASALAPGLLRYLQACSRSLQLSAGLHQVLSAQGSAVLCRPFPRLSLLFQGLCISLQTSFRSLPVTAGLCRPDQGLCISNIVISFFKIGKVHPFSPFVHIIRRRCCISDIIIDIIQF